MPAPNPPVAEPKPLALSATLSASRNQLVKDLAACIARYNLLFRAFALQKRANAGNTSGHTLDATGVALLDRMSLLSLTYLAAKPPGARKARGQSKWYDMAAFMRHIQVHAKYLNIKLLDGDFSGNHIRAAKPDGVNYWLERLDPQNNPLNQWDEFVVWAQRHDKTEFTGDSSDDRPILEYLDEADRERYRVDAVNGRVCYESREWLDTSGGNASFSQAKGVYIYVCSARTRNIYSFNSVLHQMHHSSFLQGEPVLAAGDWQVIDGEVLYVDGQSGHYKPSFDQLRTFAQACQAFWSPRTVIRPWFDRPHDATLMRNFIRLGRDAPLLKPGDQLLQSPVASTLTPRFRHVLKERGVDPAASTGNLNPPTPNSYVNSVARAGGGNPAAPGYVNPVAPAPGGGPATPPGYINPVAKS